MLLIVHTPEDVARAPLGARLITPHDFCCYAGVGLALRIQDSGFRIQKAKKIQNAEGRILIGCGDNAAICHDALRMGIRHVYSACAPEMIAKLRAIAAPLGAVIITDYPTGAVDIRTHGWENIAKQS